MIQYQPLSPVDIRFVSAEPLRELFAGLSDRRVLILASDGSIKRLKAHGLLGDLINSGQNRVIRDINSNPSVEDVCRHLNELRHDDRYDCILAVGGGSSIDLAKALSALQGLAGMRDAEYEEVVVAIGQKAFFSQHTSADIIAVPTTAGTGSEVTKWATVWDFRNKKKLSVEHPGCFPKFALISPELTADMPSRLTLATGLDALSHAMEAFWARQRNPLSQALALDAIRKIRQSLPEALAAPDDIDIRREMCLGSVLAGLAFSVTRTTACHSISYPLTMQHGIEHGFAAALTLPAMLRINAKVVTEIAAVLDVFGGAEGFDEWIGRIAQGIQELRLSSFGISESMIGDIVEGAFTQGRMDNNPVELDREAVKAVLYTII